MSTAPLTAWPRPPRAAPASREASWHLPRRWETRTSQPHRRPDDEEGPRRASVRYALDPGHDQPTHPPRCSSLSSWSKHEAPAGATRGNKRSAQRKTPPSLPISSTWPPAGLESASRASASPSRTAKQPAPTSQPCGLPPCPRQSPSPCSSSPFPALARRTDTRVPAAPRCASMQRRACTQRPPAGLCFAAATR